MMPTENGIPQCVAQLRLEDEGKAEVDTKRAANILQQK